MATWCRSVPSGSLLRRSTAWTAWAISAVFDAIRGGLPDGELFAPRRQATKRWVGQTIINATGKTADQAARVVKQWTDNGVLVVEKTPARHVVTKPSASSWTSRRPPPSFKGWPPPHRRLTSETRAESRANLVQIGLARVPFPLGKTIDPGRLPLRANSRASPVHSTPWPPASSGRLEPAPPAAGSPAELSAQHPHI